MLLTVAFNYFGCIVASCGIVINMIWCFIEIKGFHYHRKIPRFPLALDILTITLTIKDLYVSIFFAIFNGWMISVNSTPNIHVNMTKVMFVWSTCSILIANLAAMLDLLLTAKVSIKFLKSDESYSMKKFVVFPMIIILFISCTVGITAVIIGDSELLPSHSYAFAVLNQSDTGSYINAAMLTVSITGMVSAVFYYQYKVIKISINNCKQSSSNQISVKQINISKNKKCTKKILPIVSLVRKISGLEMNRLAVTANVLTLTYIVAYGPIFIYIMIQIFDAHPDAWTHFLCCLPCYIYNSGFNGFIICNCSPTYFQILTSTLICTSFQDTKIVPNHDGKQLSIWDQSESFQGHSEAVKFDAEL